jgi:uncharacterized protein (DUF2235 family)
MPRTLCVFSDGTGQRGVRVDDGATNIFKMYEWARSVPNQPCFYDAGVGTEPGKTLSWSRWAQNLVGKATGSGITQNIHDCYEFLLLNWDGPAETEVADNRVAVFGFSRGAYTARSLASVVLLCGIPAPLQKGIDITTDNANAKKERDRIIAEAIGIYQTQYGPRGAEERRAKAAIFRQTYACHDAPVHLVAVFDTVAALGLPGVMNLANPFRHRFHDAKLSSRVPFGFQALAIDENRKVFAPVPWDETEAHPSQRIDQVWFPGVHSDIGGGYPDRGLSDMALAWMIAQCSQPGVDIRFQPDGYSFAGSLTARQHDERTGFGMFWREGDRSDFILKHDPNRDRLCDQIEDRFNDATMNYRPKALGRPSVHPRLSGFYPR